MTEPFLQFLTREQLAHATTISITELHRHTGAILRRCDDGEIFVITRYGVPQVILCAIPEHL